MRLRRTLLSLVLTVAAVTIAARSVAAHQLATRVDAPLPLLFAGAGVTGALR